MIYKILQKDPFGILDSTNNIVKNLKFIAINEIGLENIVGLINQKIKSGLESAETSFWSTGNFENDIQLVFFEDVVNFSFWSEFSQPRWTVKYPNGNNPSGGWYSLVASFHRALDQGLPILNAGFMANLLLLDCERIFKGENNINIPMAEARKNNLNEAGSILKRDFGGKFINTIKAADYDAIKIVKLICEKFPSFRDETNINGEKILFLKRAQICASDIASIFVKYKKEKIKSLDALTAFADYKLPQILRKYGAISYVKNLAGKVDNYIQIASQSREEIEIRSATIWCVELLRQELKRYTAAQIDNALWFMSQDQNDIKLYHRTRTIFY